MNSVGRRWLRLLLPIAAAALVIVPPVVYQVQHYFLGWHDVANYARALYNFLEWGRFVIFSDGTGDFFVDQHFEPFFLLLWVPVRLFGTPGFVGAVTSAIVVAAGAAYLLAETITGSRTIAALVAAAFALNPYTTAIALSYHPETFGILFVLTFAWAAWTDRRVLACLALCLALTVKEDMWLYGAVAALMVWRPIAWRATVVYLAIAVAYYVVIAIGLGKWLYPTANYFNVFFETEGHPVTKVQIALMFLERWRTFLPALFTGPGAAFQWTFGCVCVLAGWRYVLLAGVMLIWLTYPGGPPRSDFEFYYSYPAFMLSWIAVPFALNNVRSLSARWLTPRVGHRVAAGAAATVAACAALSHLPPFLPAAIAPIVDLRTAFGDGPHVNAAVVTPLIRQHIRPNQDSVLTQFFLIAAIPQRRSMYVTGIHDDGRSFIEGRLQPTFVLIDANALDPWFSQSDVDAIVRRLRTARDYSAVYDANGVLLYRRAPNQ